jgi:hypothetical protein
MRIGLGVKLYGAFIALALRGAPLGLPCRR